MNLLNNISNFFGKYMAVIVLVVTAATLFIPQTGLWVSLSWINYLLMIIMFGMGLTLKFEDFKLVFVRPKDIITGCVAQFTIMPLIAFMLCKLFNLDAALMTGVILVGACPGGTSSNVITYLSKGDVALSVSMTSVNTILAPILTPLITYLLLSTTVNVDTYSMFISIINVVIIPIVLGFIINKFFGTFTQKAIKVLPVISVTGICMIVASVVSHNASKILSTGLIVFTVVILHNVLGYACGFGLGKMLKFNIPKTKAISIEIGMQNSGLATSLASTSFASLAMATVPGAIFSVWHNISGAILANIFNRWNENKNEQIKKHFQGI
ncbi:bile acid:sodium symporter family protein [Candidatus Ruminimicrobiellum ovillum]|uniref:bile acid:sodium symporter family protein n=1 Tax=Candidatus Ruminimicrobiellum ovillum TaxID=1947927 RepID=UPI00355A336A